MLRDDAAPTLRSPRRLRPFPLLAGAVLLSVLAATVVASGHGLGDPVLTITNTSAEPLEVSVGGDRVRIIAGHDTEFLELPPYAWAWKRRIQVRRWPHGELLLDWRADLSDLADNHLRLRIP